MIKPKKTKNKTFTLRLEQQTIDAIEKIASKYKCTTSEVIRQILDSAIKSEDKL